MSKCPLVVLHTKGKKCPQEIQRIKHCQTFEKKETFRDHFHLAEDYQWNHMKKNSWKVKKSKRSCKTLRDWITIVHKWHLKSWQAEYITSTRVKVSRNWKVICTPGGRWVCVNSSPNCVQCLSLVENFHLWFDSPLKHRTLINADKKVHTEAEELPSNQRRVTNLAVCCMSEHNVFVLEVHKLYEIRIRFKLTNVRTSYHISRKMIARALYISSGAEWIGHAVLNGLLSAQWWDPSIRCRGGSLSRWGSPTNSSFWK